MAHKAVEFVYADGSRIWKSVPALGDVYTALPRGFHVEGPETTCLKRDDKTHCQHWYEGDQCCSCLLGQRVDPQVELDTFQLVEMFRATSSRKLVWWEYHQYMKPRSIEFVYADGAPVWRSVRELHDVCRAEPRAPKAEPDTFQLVEMFREETDRWEKFTWWEYHQC